MKNLIGMLFAMLLVAVPMLASAESAPTAPIVVAAADVPAVAPAPAAPSAPAMTVNKADTTWMIVSTLLVILMTIPGLALFYGGLVRSKNMLSTLMHVFVVFCLISVLWVAYGYSMAFSANSVAGLNSYIGGGGEGVGE